MEIDADWGRNFDDLAQKFDRKIYGGIKGKIRQAVIKKDLAECLPGLFFPVCSKSIKILDAGCGSAPISLSFAEHGHKITLCDISSKMLAGAQKRVDEKKHAHPVSYIHSPIQALKCKPNSFDIVFCHAVVEWVKNPMAIISQLTKFIRPSGFLSLTFYNIDGMIFKNLLRTNYKKIVEKQYQGWEGSLTPTYPRACRDVKAWMIHHHMEILLHSGIRVFHDYILDPDVKEKESETVVQLELEFSRKSPFRELGRYQHLLCRKV